MFCRQSGTTTGTVPPPEDNKCQRLTPQSHRPQVASSSGDQVEYSDNDDCVSNSYEYELNADSDISLESRLESCVQFWKDTLSANVFVKNTIEFVYVIPFSQSPSICALKK